MNKHKSGKSSSSLLDLRIALLQTIALVWEDDSKNGHLREKLVNMHPKQVVDWMAASQIKFTMPYKNFGLDFLKAQAVWDLYGDHQWTKHQEEIITITLPTVPSGAKWSQYEKAEKLMEYYKYFQTFFGPAKGDEIVEGGGGESVSLPSGVDMAGNDYNLGLSPDGFQAFSAMFIKLIAAVWETPELLKKIIYKPGDSDQEYYQYVDTVLKQYFQYESPWKFNFKFLAPTESSEEFWLKEDDKWVWNSAPVLRNWVSIELPHTPSSQKENVSLALARYNAIGPAYPFTCS